MPLVQWALKAENRNVVSANAAKPSGAGSAIGGTETISVFCTVAVLPLTIVDMLWLPFQPV